MLKEKAAQFNADGEIQMLITAYKVKDESLSSLSKSYSSANAAALKAHSFDRAALGARGPGLERLDQLTVDLLLGMR